MYRQEIINATTKLIIDVPEQLTKSTRRKNSYHCVFAEACNSIPKVEEAIVHISTAYLRFKGEKLFRRYRVNTRLRDQIIMFDRFGVFDPGQYTLALIQQSHQATGVRQGTGGSGRQPEVQVKRKRALLKGVRAPAKISAL